MNFLNSFDMSFEVISKEFFWYLPIHSRQMAPAEAGIPRYAVDSNMQRQT
jgi:hypothetical protein